MDIFYGVSLEDVSYGQQGQSVKVLQALLNGSGNNCGLCDGIYGTKTRTALHSFKKSRSLPVNDLVNKEVWNKLFNF
jgi:peptidoglycan hydrolase-like protein with peptidoglycan-binding domain